MNIKVLLKFVVASWVVYEIANMSYQMGKGRLLKIMKENDITPTEMLDAVESPAKVSIRERMNVRIIEFIAKL